MCTALILEKIKKKRLLNMKWKTKFTRKDKETPHKLMNKKQKNTEK